MSESIFNKIMDKNIEQAKERIGASCEMIMTSFKNSELTLGEIEIVFQECQKRLRLAAQSLSIKDISKEIE
jgi:hypothetical protein